MSGGIEYSFKVLQGCYRPVEGYNNEKQHGDDRISSIREQGPKFQIMEVCLASHNQNASTRFVTPTGKPAIVPPSVCLSFSGW